MARPVGGLRKHPHGRVDQLEDRYLGMVEAPSSNLGTSTSLLLIENEEWNDLKARDDKEPIRNRPSHSLKKESMHVQM